MISKKKKKEKKKGLNDIIMKSNGQTAKRNTKIQVTDKKLFNSIGKIDGKFSVLISKS